jgi:hypothetical protein
VYNFDNKNTILAEVWTFQIATTPYGLSEKNSDSNNSNSSRKNSITSSPRIIINSGEKIEIDSNHF